MRSLRIVGSLIDSNMKCYERQIVFFEYIMQSSSLDYKNTIFKLKQKI